MRNRMQLLVGVIAACGLAAALAYGGRTVQLADAPTSVTDIAAQPAAMNPLLVLEQNKDLNGFIRVHEQGTVPVTGTVNIGTVSGVQNVHVQNTPLPVTGSVTVANFPAAAPGSTQLYFEEIYPFDSAQARDVDITGFSKIRVSATVNVSGQVDFYLYTNSGALQNFSVSASNAGSVLLGDVPGTSLNVRMLDPDGEQIILRVWGSN